MDILYIFEAFCDPPYLQGCPIYTLMFADDLLLLLLSQPRLQRPMDKLFDYYSGWSLEVNVGKTKAMRIRPHTRTLEGVPMIRYGGKDFDWVTAFVYLGVKIKENGTFQSNQAPMKKKAMQAQGSHNKMVKGLSFRTKMWLHARMFDPILLQGIEAWISQDVSEYIKSEGVYRTFNDNGCKPLMLEFTPCIEGIAQTIMFWNRAQKLPPKSLLGVALEQMANSNHNYIAP